MKNFSLKNAKILSICLGIYYLLSSMALGFILIVQKIVFQNIPELTQFKEMTTFLPMILDILNVYLPLMLILGLAFTFLGIFIAKVKYKFYTCLFFIATSLTMQIVFYIKLIDIIEILHAEMKDLGTFHIGLENFIIPTLTFLAPQIVLAWGLWNIDNSIEEDPLAVT